MDFHQQDIRQFLQESIPLRFRQLTPPVFGDFIRYLFEVDGYDLLPTVKEGEFAGFILAKKDESTLVIIALRQNPDEFTGEDVIRKSIRAGEFYGTDQSWVITTASFSDESKLLAEETDVELWDWEALHSALCQLFFEGKNPLEYGVGQPAKGTGEESRSALKLKASWQAAEGVGAEWFNLGLTISNPSERNIYLHLELPALIDHKTNQIMASQWVEGEFVAGMIYAGASIRTNVLFDAARLGDRPPGGKVVLTCHERLEIPYTYHLQARLQGQACFVVTYCYTTRSDEYKVMTAYRDEVLARTHAGRWLVSLYYFLSPHLVDWAARNKHVDYILRKLAYLIIPFFVGKAKQKLIQPFNKIS